MADREWLVEAREDAELIGHMQDALDALRPSPVCVCGHPKDGHAACGIGPCRTNVSIALWHGSNDRQSASCPCRSFYEPVETREVK